MFRKPQNALSGIDETIADLLLELKGYTADTDEYKATMHHVETLFKLRQLIEPERLSKDTLAIIAGNLAGIVMILSYEHIHPIASKALTFVMKAR